MNTFRRIAALLASRFCLSVWLAANLFTGMATSVAASAAASVATSVATSMAAGLATGLLATPRAIAGVTPASAEDSSHLPQSATGHRIGR